LNTQSSQIDVVLDLMSESPENDECGYYFVDHSKRVIFWLDVFNISTLQVWDFVPGIETSSHVSEYSPQYGRGTDSRRNGVGN
jgi:hypothetical protein